jgi:hypothetical protein
MQGKVYNNGIEAIPSSGETYLALAGGSRLDSTA